MRAIRTSSSDPLRYPCSALPCCCYLPWGPFVRWTWGIDLWIRSTRCREFFSSETMQAMQKAEKDQNPMVFWVKDLGPFFKSMEYLDFSLIYNFIYSIRKKQKWEPYLSISLSLQQERHTRAGPHRTHTLYLSFWEISGHLINVCIFQEMLGPCVEVGLQISQLRELTGRAEPTVITQNMRNTLFLVIITQLVVARNSKLRLRRAVIMYCVSKKQLLFYLVSYYMKWVTTAWTHRIFVAPCNCGTKWSKTQSKCRALMLN